MTINFATFITLPSKFNGENLIKTYSENVLVKTKAYTNSLVLKPIYILFGHTSILVYILYFH